MIIGGFFKRVVQGYTISTGLLITLAVFCMLVVHVAVPFATAQPSAKHIKIGIGPSHKSQITNHNPCRWTRPIL